MVRSKSPRQGFRSAITNALQLRDLDAPVGSATVEIANAHGPVRTGGSELIARYHRDDLDIIATHMFVWSTEPDPNTGVRREVPLNPRHTAGLDFLWRSNGAAAGASSFSTQGGSSWKIRRYRTESHPYLLWGASPIWRFGKARLFINVENLSDVRQTAFEHSFVTTEGLLAVDGMGPLDGRVLKRRVAAGIFDVINRRALPKRIRRRRPRADTGGLSVRYGESSSLLPPCVEKLEAQPRPRSISHRKSSPAV